MALQLSRLILLALFCFAPLVAQAVDLQRLQAMHEFRSQGYTAATYLLIDNNLYEKIREPENRIRYNEALSNMDAALRTLGMPAELSALKANLQLTIRELEGQPEEEAHFNLSTVNRIMQIHGQLDRMAANEYAGMTEGAPAELLTLHAQSLEISQILLLYQNNMFSSVGVYFMDNEDGMFTMLDNRITERAGELRKLFPDLQARFERLDKQYDFIRPRLLKYYEDWVPSMAAFYLQRNTRILDELSREQVRVSSLAQG